MSIMAGIFSRNRSSRIPSNIVESIRKHISRKYEDNIQEYWDDHFFVAKLDIGAYGSPAFQRDDDGYFSGLTGEPLLDISGQDKNRNREQDLALLHREWKKGNWSLLNHVNGLFCAAHYNPVSHTLMLLCDKHGLRPFYYWENEKYVIFSTALRILEDLDVIPKRLDIISMLQMQTLKFSLADRTPYADIKRIEAGQIISFSSKSKEMSSYWRWDTVPCSKESEQEQLRQLYRRFRLAVKRRLGDDKVTVCALSGGLDSRCIVGVLRDLDVTVHTFNFAPPGTQDSVLAAMFAREIGSIHREISLNTQTDDPLSPIAELSRAWKGTRFGGRKPADRPLVVWSGAGGSVGLGHVYTTKPVIDFMRNNKPESAIDFYLKKMRFGIGGKIFKPKIRVSFSKVLKVGIQEILNGLHHEDPARNFYLFLMLYEQRGLFTGYYEEIDIHRLEFHSPFLDSHFFEAIVASPIDLCLNHHLYHRWLKLFPEPVYSVPWQSYPEHEPCPHPIPEDLTWQWDGAYKIPEHEAWLKQNRLKKARQLLKRDNFPHALARRWYFASAMLAYKYGLRDYGWLIDKIDYISRYWSKCNGEYEITLPSCTTV